MIRLIVEISDTCDVSVEYSQPNAARIPGVPDVQMRPTVTGLEKHKAELIKTYINKVSLIQMMPNTTEKQ